MKKYHGWLSFRYWPPPRTQEIELWCWESDGGLLVLV